MEAGASCEPELVEAGASCEPELLEAGASCEPGLVRAGALGPEPDALELEALRLRPVVGVHDRKWACSSMPDGKRALQRLHVRGVPAWYFSPRGASWASWCRTA